MGTTADKLNKILETKAAIKQAIIDKGVDISDTDTFASYPEKIESIQAGGPNYYEEFFNCVTDNNTDYTYLFHNYKGEQIDISGLDSSNVTDMSYMFEACRYLTSIDLSALNTTNVVNMRGMFEDCIKLTSINVSNFNTSKVTNMNSMFAGSIDSIKITEFIGLDKFDISKVTNMDGMFSKNWVITSLDLSFWDIKNVSSLRTCVNNCTKLVDFYPPQNINADMVISSSSALSHDSLVRIINNLTEVTTTKTLTLGTTNLAKLSDEEKAVATNKGWTLK